MLGFISDWDWRRIVFSLLVLGYLGFLGYINLMMFVPGSGISAMDHFSFIRTGDTHDLIHELVFALIIGTAAVGLLSQLWKPAENFAGQIVALTAWVVLAAAAALTGNWVPQPFFLIFGGLTLAATVLHPRGTGLFTWFGAARTNRILLGLVAIAAVPLLLLAAANISLQGIGLGTGFFDHNPPAFHGGSAQGEPAEEDVHVEDEGDHDQRHINLGHYRNIAALSLIILLTGLLASFRPGGWRLAAWVAGGLPILLGLVSLIFPEAESALSTGWSFAAILWGVAFIAAAEATNKG